MTNDRKNGSPKRWNDRLQTLCAWPTPLESVGGIVAGIDEGADYQCGRITLQPGEGLFLFTDGVTEAMNPSRRRYTGDRLSSVLHPPAASANELIERVIEDVRAFSEGVEHSDDITALALRFPG